MRLKKRKKQTKSAGKQSSVLRWGENDTDTNDETLNQEEEASINNNDTADASINNEEDDTNMDIADSDISHIIPNSIEVPSLDNAKPKPLSKTQRNNRNQRIRKAEVQLDNEQFDAALQSLALQNAVEQELPFHPIPNDRRPKRKIKKPTKLQDPNHWCLPDPLSWCPPEKLLHRPWKSTQPPKDPKQKKVRLPPFDYTIPPKSRIVSKLKNNFPSYKIFSKNLQNLIRL